MEARCNYCEMFGEKPHCHNCKILKQAREYAPKEIECSLEELVEYINTHEDITEKFNVGDYKTIELYTGEKVKIVLMDVGKDKIVDTTANARATFGVLKFDGSFEMNRQNTNEGGWGKSKMRVDYMSRIFQLLPQVLKDNIKTVEKFTSAGSRNRDIVKTEDKLFLFSEIEIYGKTRYSVEGEGEQYEYFSNEQNRNFERDLWLRSPYYDNSGYFCYAYSRSNSGASSANYCCGLALGFCV